MGLKDKWVDKVDEVDDVVAEDINSIAHAVIALEEDQEDADESNINIDTEMSDASENPVQNKVIKSYIDNQVGDIETALDSIIAIQEELISRPLITFYIDHYGDLGTYQAVEGWTFGDWCGSEYDTLGCRASTYVYAPDGIGIISGGTIQYNPDESTPIEAGVTYSF